MSQSRGERVLLTWRKVGATLLVAGLLLLWSGGINTVVAGQSTLYHIDVDGDVDVTSSDKHGEGWDKTGNKAGNNFFEGVQEVIVDISGVIEKFVAPSSHTNVVCEGDLDKDGDGFSEDQQLDDVEWNQTTLSPGENGIFMRFKLTVCENETTNPNDGTYERYLIIIDVPDDDVEDDGTTRIYSSVNALVRILHNNSDETGHIIFETTSASITATVMRLTGDGGDGGDGGGDPCDKPNPPKKCG